MATGLEALGAASAVLQVISFSCSVASLCYKIYDGKPTAEHDLEDYASRMIEAAGQVQTRCQAMPHMTTAEKKLAEIGAKCQGAAQALEKEAQYVTELCKKGKLRQAVWATLRSSKHKKNVERLQMSLDGYTQVMETQLLLNLCTTSDAIELKQSQRFQTLTSDVQDFISRMADGHKKIEGLIKTEHNTTRDHVKREAEITRGDVKTHMVSEVQALGVRAATDAQRERLLKSLKADVMNQRYNNVMDSNAATFERVFLSFDHMCQRDPNDWQPLDRKALDVSGGAIERKPHWELTSDAVVQEIDERWRGFISWLQSDNRNIFWIRGKPGSGKSTLMKFVIDNDNTGKLLGRWRPGTKILSHFFWKIGSPPQNSIKGLLCSLLHCILRESSLSIEEVLNHFKNSSSKDSYDDWSAAELEKLVLFLLAENMSPVCIFIDGLDEISSQDGYFKLLNVVEQLNAWDHVKVCVSSRPETQLVQRFQRIAATSIRLEDLTRPEMSVYVHKELKPFNASGEISSSLLEELTRGLLYKAQGVFLWLFLATRSLINGVQNRDDEGTLLQRFKELPEELEDLYADMWKRLKGNNSVYRETAARYFRFVVTGAQPVNVTKQTHNFFILRPTLLEIALAERTKDREVLTHKANDSSHADLKMLCETTAETISTRCAGLLQLTRGVSGRNIDEIPHLDEIKFLNQVVSFIHRTAHDFLVETQAGQEILNYKHIPSLSVRTDVTLVKSMLCVANILAREFNFVTDVDDVIGIIADTARKGGIDESEMTAILPIGLELWEAGVISAFPRRWGPGWGFFPLLAWESPLFDDFVLSTLKQADSDSDSDSTVITDTLRNICAMAVWKQGNAPIRMMQELMSMGADPHAIGWWNFHQGGQLGSTTTTHTHQVTAYGLFLTFAWNYLRGKAPDMSGIVGVIDTMTQARPNWQTRILLNFFFFSRTLSILTLPWADTSHGSLGFYCEVDLQYLLAQILAAVDSINPATHDSRLHNVAAGFTEPGAIIRFIRKSNDKDGSSYYRILNQQPFQYLIGVIFGPQLHSVDLDGDLDSVSSLVNDPALAKRVDFGTELDMLAEEIQVLAKVS
ncbi:hypothetical protein EDB81DRAFT_943351 [Dactylonectria macrodidyma]|uniref:NACHT domain-containing protein n=1 Tax=Dactylonectria macrodidyma TaxID=307937 RepID=A0A9P9JKR3_9HYPO|nr:hypothetical protein EDB81DRAFT_943351 [Dactylonectria macrodidyma]